MNRDEYHEAFDSLSFSEDFQLRTEELLNRAVQETAEQEVTMKHSTWFGKRIAFMAAVIAVLVISVSAVYSLLSPKEVAQEMNDSKLAAAFESEDAVVMNKTAQIGDYTFTLAGMVSGSNLSEWGSNWEEDHTYVVASMARTDGTLLDSETWDAFAYTITPLVQGYPAWVVNNWTLDAYATCDVLDGIAYYILDVQNLRLFADSTIYLAVYEGGSVPSRNEFDQTMNSPITLKDGINGAMFVLPLDNSQADPAAAEQFVIDAGFGEALELFRSGAEVTAIPSEGSQSEYRLESAEES